MRKPIDDDADWSLIREHLELDDFPPETWTTVTLVAHAGKSRGTLVTIEARPEAVDEITNTALPVAEETVRFSTNLISITSMSSLFNPARRSALRVAGTGPSPITRGSTPAA